MEAETNAGAIVVDELKKQAKAEGYYVLCLEQSTAWLLLCCLLYFWLGYTFASR